MRIKAKAFSYSRFSTPEQALGDSERRQIENATKYASEHDLELDTTTYKDLGVSAFRGKNFTDGALGRFYEAVVDGDIPAGSYLIVESLDRISRCDPNEAMYHFLGITLKGINIVTLVDGRVYTKSNQKQLQDILSSLLVMSRANDESATKSFRGKNTWINKRRNASSIILTKKCPAWLKVEDGKFVIIDPRAEIVRQIYKLSLCGLGHQAIASKLNTEGVPAFGKGNGWQKSSVSKILSNASVIGTFIPHTVEYDDMGKRSRKPTEPIKGYFPAIIDDESYSEVQLLNTGRRAASKTSTKIQSMLAGLTKCPLCGSSMTRVVKGNGAKPRFVCSNARRSMGCKTRSVLVETVETALIDNCSYLLGTAPVADGVLESQIEEIEINVDAIKERISFLSDTISRTPYSPSLTSELVELEETVTALNAKKIKLLKEVAALSKASVAKKMGKISAQLDLDAPDKTIINNNFRQLLDHVVVNYVTGHLEFKWKSGGESSLFFMWPAGDSNKAPTASLI